MKRTLIVLLGVLYLAAWTQGQCDEVSSGGQTPLHAAAWKGDVAQIEALIAGGADVNSASSFGTTPLHAAAVKNQLQAIKVLLRLGARIDARDGLGRTPLFAALEVGASRPVIALLLEAGAAADAKDTSGKSPVEVAWTDEVRTVLKQHLAHQSGQAH